VIAQKALKTKCGNKALKAQNLKIFGPRLKII